MQSVKPPGVVLARGANAAKEELLDDSSELSREEARAVALLLSGDPKRSSG